ncbi:hypothetical protein Taro_009811, partial [Colocasia esculenta]|nr:hypothetical protein [Colocasia esculenta]
MIATLLGVTTWLRRLGPPRQCLYRCDFSAAAGRAPGGGDGAVVMVPVASCGSPSECTSPSGYAPKGLPFRVFGSVGGDCENRVLDVGR